MDDDDDAGEEVKLTKGDPSPGGITHKISSANHFDPRALERNRSGRLSGGQYLNAFRVIGLFILMLAGAIYLFINIAAGGKSINDGQFQQALLPCGSSIAVFALVLWLYSLGDRIGIQRYMARSPLDLLWKSLVVVDILLGKVDHYEGVVSREKEVETEYQKNSSGFSEPRRTTRYFYRGGGNDFRVSEEGYSAFSSKSRRCRLYYLPTSKVIVNLEVL